jgi:hypothetical protein
LLLTCQRLERTLERILELFFVHHTLLASRTLQLQLTHQLHPNSFSLPSDREPL